MIRPKLDIVPYSQTLRAEAMETLGAAMKEDYEGVIVFGFKDGRVYRHWSLIENTVEKIGFLEEAKYALLQHTYCKD